MGRDTQNTARKLSDPSEWLDRHGDALYRYALLRVGKTQVAEDLVQEAFLGALRSRAKYTGQAAERTWFIAILRHKILNHIRQAGKRAAEGSDSGFDQMQEFFFTGRGKWKDNPSSWGIEPDRIVEQSEFWEVFRRCLSGLPPQAGHAYLLREMDQLSSAKICKVLDISENNLWTRLHRARMMLRRCLEDNWSSEGVKRTKP